MQKQYHVVFDEILTNEKRSMKNPVLHIPQIWLFLLNVLPQMPQNITVEILIGSQALGDEFSVHNATFLRLMLIAGLPWTFFLF